MTVRFPEFEFKTVCVRSLHLLYDFNPILVIACCWMVLVVQPTSLHQNQYFKQPSTLTLIQFKHCGLKLIDIQEYCD